MSQTIAHAMSKTTQALEDGHVSDTPQLDARLIIRHALGVSTERLFLIMDRPLDDAQQQRIDAMVAQRLDHQPMAYILGEKEFHGHTFHVDPRVLIPRPDTETLVEAALGHLQGKHDASILDVCTGSGCVGISIAAQHPDAQVTLIDISPDALDVAKMNCMAILDHDLQYIQGNLLQSVSANTETYDIIASNPPYLTDAWCDNVEPDVQREPRLALAGGDEDGLALIRILIAQAVPLLKDGGALLIECDYRQCADVQALMHQHGLHDITIERDLSGKERVVWGRRQHVRTDA